MQNRYEQQIDDRYEQMYDKSLGVIIIFSYSIFSILYKADFSVIFIFLFYSFIFAVCKQIYVNSTLTYLNFISLIPFHAKKIYIPNLNIIIFLLTCSLLYCVDT